MDTVRGNNSINRVKVVDDDPYARKTASLWLLEAKYTPVEEPGPINNLEVFVKTSVQSVDAVLCDHRLTTYAKFSGAEAVAAFYKEHFPAILCTAWSRADIDAMRPYRRHIPVVIAAGEANIESIVSGFQQCLLELNGEFVPKRKPWRTLLRIVDVDAESNEHMTFLIIPAWNSEEVIRIPLTLFPADLVSKISPGFRFYAQVNIGAEDQNDLYFDSFEEV